MLKHGMFSFHIVDESPWPLYLSLGVFSTMVSFLELCLMEVSSFKVLTCFIYCILSFFGWVRDISTEGFQSGMHTFSVQSGLKMGFLLFIISEVMFFGSFFWSLFYYSVSPSVLMGGWPPIGLVSVNPMGIPLLGTIILMSSGISITWSHYSMMSMKKYSCVTSLMMTIMLGITFSILQLSEYLVCSFSISDSVYGSIFYMATGFHGFHVLIGSMFLIACLIRIQMNQMSNKHHLGFEFAIWYWHFVDVVWLLLYVCLYWWGY